MGIKIAGLGYRILRNLSGSPYSVVSKQRQEGRPRVLKYAHALSAYFSAAFAAGESAEGSLSTPNRIDGLPAIEIMIAQTFDIVNSDTNTKKCANIYLSTYRRKKGVFRNTLLKKVKIFFRPHF